MTTTERTAKCLCGQLSVTVQGSPGGVNMCSCTGCQRTSGSAFSYTLFFPEPQVVKIEGNASHYKTKGDAGRFFETGFCPTCGSSVYRRLDVIPGALGVFGGCFADEKLEKPQTWYHTAHRHHWLSPIEGVNDMETQESN